MPMVVVKSAVQKLLSHMDRILSTVDTFSVRGHLFNDSTIELSMITVSRFSQDSLPFSKQKIFSAGQEGDSPFAAKCWDSLE